MTEQIFKPGDQRPSRSNPRVMENAARRLAPRIIEWDGALTEDEIVEALAKHGTYDVDGYALAKRLEDCEYWSPDENLVDILAAFQSELYDAHRQLVKVWVKEAQIALPLNVGDMVQWLQNGKQQTGKITKLNAEEAIYYIQIDGGDPSHSYLVEFERASLLPAPAEAA